MIKNLLEDIMIVIIKTGFQCVTQIIVLVYVKIVTNKRLRKRQLRWVELDSSPGCCLIPLKLPSSL